MSAALDHDPVGLVLDRLNAAGCTPKQSAPGQWNAKCPVIDGHAHGDKNPSLSVGTGPDGKALVCCHKGCRLPDIAHALQLGVHDLFPPKPRAAIANGRRIRSTYPYYDADGTLLFEVVRYEPKGFAQRQPDGKGGWTWSLKGVEWRPLYMLPQLRRAIERGERVFLTEGEKDAEALQWAAEGLGAVGCNSGGAGKWRPEYAEQLAGAGRIVIVLDNDDAGLAHAKTFARELTAAGFTDIVVSGPPARFKDAAEALAAGAVIGDFIKHWHSGLGSAWYSDAAEATPEPESEEQDDPVLPTVSLDELLDTDEGPYDWVCEGLIERCDRIVVTGLEGSGKSTLLRQMAAQLAHGIHPFTLEPVEPLRVLYLDCENSRRQVRRKAGPLRKRPGAMLEFAFRPDGIDLTDLAHVVWVEQLVRECRPDVVFVGPIYKMANGDPKDEQTAKAVASAVDQLRTNYGFAVVIEAHTPYADGAKSKRPERPYGASLWSRWPEFGIFLAPDGELRHWRGQRDERAWPKKLRRGGSEWPWEVEEEAEMATWDGPTKCMEAVVEYLADVAPGELSGNQLHAGMKGIGNPFRRDTVVTAAERLAHDGRIQVRTGPRNARLYSSLSVTKQGQIDHGESDDDELF